MQCLGEYIVGACAGDKTELQTALNAAKLAEQDALSSAHRLETELSDLASAYNNLEVQSYQLEAQIKRLQQQADHAAPSTGGFVFSHAYQAHCCAVCVCVTFCVLSCATSSIAN